MLDYQRIVDDVRSSLYSHGGDGMDFLRAAAADYSVACDELNERLRQCGSLLRQGLRSEAIQLSELEPNLLDVVALLDFPERAQWLELADRSGMASSTPLMLDVAAELNEAYALEQPLAALLQHHRLLALAHCPLPARIQALRQLAELDPNNPVWQQDLQTFEQERQKQLEAEVQTATRAGDAAALAALDAELSSPEWKNAPALELATSAGEANVRLRYWAVQSQLEELATELNAAMSGRQVEHGQTLYDRWNEVITTSGWQPYEQLAQRAAAALTWIADRREHEAAVAALAHAVDQEPSVLELQKVYAIATQVGRVPADLENRYRKRLLMLERAVKLRRWLRLGGIAAGVTALIIIIGLVVSHERQAQEISTAIKTLEFLIERGECDRAEAEVKKLSQSAAQDPRIQELIAQLQEAVKKDKTRKMELSQRLGTATHWLNEVHKSLIDKPTQTVLDHLREELDRIHKDIERATGLVRSDQERSSVASAAEFADQLKNEWQSQLDAAFLGQYDNLDRRLKLLERDTTTDVDTQKTRLSDYRTELQKWEIASGYVSPALRSRITAIGDRLSALENSTKRWEQEESDEKQIMAAVGDISAYVKALQEYILHNPSADHTPNFKCVVDESLCWHAITEWNTLARQRRSGSIIGIRPAIAKEQFTLARTVSDTFADCTECAGLRSLLPYLSAIARRDNAGEGSEVPLKKLFSDPLVAYAWMIETKNGDSAKRYYSTSRPDEEAARSKRVVKYLVSFDGKQARSGSLPVGEEIIYVGRAPQAALAEQVQKFFNALNDDNWENSFCQMITAIRDDRTTDAILKANLLQQTLETGIRGSYCLEKAFGRHLAWLKEAKIDAFANWLNPRDTTVAEARRETARKLEDFPAVDEPIKTAMQDVTSTYQLAEFRWVGWLHQRKDGRWECLLKSAIDSTGSLFVVHRPSTEGKPALSVIGRFDHGTATVDTTSASLLVGGRPVYIRVP